MAFSVLFNIPKEQYFYCGLSGMVSWATYSYLLEVGSAIEIAAFVATMVLTFGSRVLAVWRKMPISVFLVAGILPMVPGAGIYFTAYHFIINENMIALTKGLESAKVAVAIALGIMFILSLPNSFFNRLMPRK